MGLHALSDKADRKFQSNAYTFESERVTISEMTLKVIQGHQHYFELGREHATYIHVLHSYKWCVVTMSFTGGVATGVYGYIYIPPKSVQVNFLRGRNDVRTAIEHAY